MRLWDCSSEMKVCDIPTQVDSCVTCIQTGSGDNSHVVAVSFGDGHVKMFDTRSRQCVLTSREHKQMVLGLRYQTGHGLVSSCAEGVVKVWDVRRQSSVLTHSSGQSCLSVDIHPSTHILALASTTGQLSVFSVRDGKMINIIRPAAPASRHVNNSVTCLR